MFHAGTSRPDPAGPFVTAGGRVLGVTAVAPTLSAARAKAYAALEPIHWDGMLVRSDIAARAAEEIDEVVTVEREARAFNVYNDDVEELVR